MIIEYAGKTYTSKNNGDVSAAECAKTMYDQLGELATLFVETDEGFLILHQEVIRRSVIKFVP